MIDLHHGWNASFKPVFLGFVVSLILVIATYFIFTKHHLSDGALILTIAGITIAGALVQLFFFLHLGMESKPHWNTITFVFGALVIIIVIGGSLWIMNNVMYDLMPPMPEMHH